jgi:PAS domain S-box-containing protein
MKAPLPPDEQERLNVLRRYEILDTDPEQNFDDLALLASQMCGTPIAMISFVEENRQWFKSSIGIAVKETSRDIAFCAHGILETGLFVVNDARADERFASNPMVTGAPGIRFFAGAPLITPEGHALGMLCITDVVPRELSRDQKLALEALSRQVVAQLVLRRNLEEMRRTLSDLQRAKEELQWKTAFLEANVNSSIDGILVVDEHGKKILQNQRTTELFKIPQAIAEGNDDAAQIRYVAETVKNPEQFVEKVAHLTAHPNEISRDETELKDGTILDRYSSPVTGKDGKYYGRIWTFRDITDRKRDEEALQESQALYHSLVDELPVGIFRKDRAGRFVFANPWSCQLRGLPLDQILGRTPEELGVLEVAAHGQTRPEVLKSIREGTTHHEKIMSTGLPIQVDEIHPADGEGKRYLHVLKSAVFGPSGKIIGTQGVQFDITERKQMEESLQESEEKFRQLANNITDVFWMTSPDFNEMHYISPGYELIWGRSMQSLYDNPHQWVEAILPAEREQAFAIFGKLMANTPTVSVEYQISRPDGTIRWIHDRGFQVRDAAGNLIRLAGIASDITERKKFEAKSFQSQKLETVGKLAGGFAHEFNSILTAIIGQSELLLVDLPTESPLARNAMEINMAASRAATLTRQLLAYGRKQILQPEVLDLNSILTRMESTLRHLTGAITDVRIIPAAGLKTVKADAGQIEQVLLNIVMNAADAMPNGGKLTLETANVSFDEAGVERFPELKPGDYAMLAISDTGPGMSEEIKAHVFEPFFSTKDVGQGTGLGLSTCYGIVKQSGGHIGVYSEPGRGTTFKIYLPQMELPPKIFVQPHHLPALPRGTETILLVEDDPALREMAATMLSRLGYTVLTAANGIEALSLKQQRGIGHVDLLFTDIVMPHMNGKELADRLLKFNPHTKILFTSAYTENAIVHQGILDKGVALLQKPFTPSALAHKLREVLDQPGAQKTDDPTDGNGPLISGV